MFADDASRVLSGPKAWSKFNTSGSKYGGSKYFNKKRKSIRRSKGGKPLHGSDSFVSLRSLFTQQNNRTFLKIQICCHHICCPMYWICCKLLGQPLSLSSPYLILLRFPAKRSRLPTVLNCLPRSGSSFFPFGTKVNTISDQWWQIINSSVDINWFCNANFL